MTGDQSQGLKVGDRVRWGEDAGDQGTVAERNWLVCPSNGINVHKTGCLHNSLMLISEVNGRISELRAKGYVIETSVGKDRYGFAYHRLARAPHRIPAVLL
jgi:hypothetical protein